MNKIIVIGNLGQDPTMRYTPTGQMVTSFSVASNHRYRAASGEQKEETDGSTAPPSASWLRLVTSTSPKASKSMLRAGYPPGPIRPRGVRPGSPSMLECRISNSWAAGAPVYPQGREISNLAFQRQQVMRMKLLSSPSDPARCRVPMRR